jgi:hypothetical protein
VYCFSAAQEWKGWRREETGCSFDGTTTVKWRKVRTEARELHIDELRLSRSGFGNRVYTNTLDAFLGSAWREGRLLLRQYQEFLEILVIFAGGSTLDGPLRHGRLFLARQIKSITVTITPRSRMRPAPRGGQYYTPITPRSHADSLVMVCKHGLSAITSYCYCTRLIPLFTSQRA